MDELANFLCNISISKKGLEIGGPSNRTGGVLYKFADIIDNVIFSEKTVWSEHLNDSYNYYENKSGKTYINDTTNMSNIIAKSYDFIFASHVLEHIANPIKALYEFKRVVKDDGYIILILPEKSKCFDHKRNISSFTTLLKQFNNNVEEDDLSTLPEILRLHDLSRDLQAGSFEEFTRRSLDNYNNRCLHHYVYNEELLLELCNFINCKMVCYITDDINIWFIMKKNI